MENNQKEVAYVTGGASGIGRATVERLAKDGFRVIAIDRNQQALDELKTEMIEKEFDIEIYALDVTDRQGINEMIKKEKQVDVVVCAAGTYKPKYFEEVTDDDFRKTLEINLLGVFIIAQEGVKHMKAGGRVITISSRGALGGTGFPDYVASKAGVIGLTRAMAMELRTKEIAVNSVAPGFTDTPMTRSMPDDQYAAAVNLEPSKKAASPDDIANGIAFFASPETKFVTGQTLYVDGGKSLGGLGL